MTPAADSPTRFGAGRKPAPDVSRLPLSPTLAPPAMSLGPAMGNTRWLGHAAPARD